MSVNLNGHRDPMLPTQIVTPPSSQSSREHQIATLINNAENGQWQIEKDIDWSIHPSPPNFLTQRFIGRALGALMAGEEATAAACKMLLADSPDADLSACLEYQAADEERHAKVYRAYLERVGMPPLIPDGFREATKQLVNWRRHSIQFYRPTTEWPSHYLYVGRKAQDGREFYQPSFGRSRYDRNQTQYKCAAFPMDD